MNAIAATRLLRVTEDESSNAEKVAVLGRDIRTSPERIARYCVAGHEPIYEDLATLVESMAYWDRQIVRRRTEGWSRELAIQVPVHEHRQFLRAVVLEALTEAAWFLRVISGVSSSSLARDLRQVVRGLWHCLRSR